jgi:hypothetical protein
MTMHLEGPWLSTAGKKRGKTKFRNAAEARKSRELAESWQQLLKKYETKTVVKPIKRELKDTYKLEVPPGRDTRKYQSLDTGGHNTAPVERKVYTGDKMVGIGTMHKSNMVPIFSDQEAKDISTMRRN